MLANQVRAERPKSTLIGLFEGEQRADMACYGLDGLARTLSNERK